MIYLYALCPSLAAFPEPPVGIGEAEVEVLTVEPLGAVIERDVDVAQLKANDAKLMEAVLAHDRVLGHFFSQTPLLPLRFGTQFKDIDSIKAFLADQGETYRQRLEHLLDKAEYLVKLMPQPLELPAIADELKGRDYFLAKKQRLQAQTAVLNQQAAELQQFLDGLETSNIPFVRSTPQDTEERLHILLSRDADATQAFMLAWQQQLSTWQIVCSEPLPPYHFAA